MVRCVDCVHFPWTPEADVSMLPAQRCHPDLQLQRWTNETKAIKRECQHFQGREEEKPRASGKKAKAKDADPGVKDDDPDAGTA